MAGPAPGSLVPVRPSKAALAEVRAVIDLQAAQVDHLDKDAMRALLPALVDARNELRNDLLAWLRDAPNGDERFTAQQMRRALVALESAMDRMRALAPDMESALRDNANAAGELAMSHLQEQVARFGAAFGESVYPTDLALAATIAKGDSLLIKKYRTSAARYAGAMTEDIRHQLAVGVARNETFSQLKARLVRLGGPTGMVAMRGVLGEPGAVAEYISEGLFKRHRYWAERLVRTELMEAYNLQHQDGMALLNEARDPAVTAEYVQRWDATLDRRACPICRDLDRRVAKMGGEFKGGYRTAPAHPQCRCILVAWHVSWGDIHGEVPAVEDATDPLPALPRTLAEPQKPIAAKRVAKRAAAPPAAQLPDPGQVAADLATELVGRGKWKAGRDAIDGALTADGMGQVATRMPPTNGVRSRANLRANGTHAFRDGQITLRSDVAGRAQAFARAWRGELANVQAALREAARYSDPDVLAARASRVAHTADGMRTFVHEIHHGHSPITAYAYQGHGVFTEEVTTEWAARGYMNQRFGVPRALYAKDAHPDVKSGSYRGWCTKLVEAVQAEGGLTRDQAMIAVEDAARAFKRLPQGSVGSGDQAVDTLARLLPGNADVYKVKLRAISRRDPHDES